MQRNTIQPAASDRYPSLQWHNGKSSEVITRNRQTRAQAGFVGWTVEVGKHEAFDTLCNEMGVERRTLRHMRETGHQDKDHWHLGEEALIYPLTPGPLRPVFDQATRRWEDEAALGGLVTVWPRGERSTMALLALLTVNGIVDAALPVLLTVRSTLTEHLYAALVEHCTTACAAADAAFGRMVMPWEIALPLGPGAEVNATSKQKGQGTQITPPASCHRQANGQFTPLPDELRDAAASLAEEAVTWAIAEARRRMNDNAQTAA